MLLPRFVLDPVADHREKGPAARRKALGSRIPGRLLCGSVLRYCRPVKGNGEERNTPGSRLLGRCMSLRVSVITMGAGKRYSMNSLTGASHHPTMNQKENSQCSEGCIVQQDGNRYPET